MEQTQHNYITIMLFSICCLLLIALVTQNAIAAHPEKCPSTLALQHINIQKSDLMELRTSSTSCCTANGFPYTIDGEWGIKEYTNNYDTEDTWVLRLHSVIANNQEEAFLKMQRTLPTLKLSYGPLSYMGRWSCGYYSTAGNVGVHYLY